MIARLPLAHRRVWNWKEKKYLIADVPRSRISFKVTTSIGIVQITYQRSREYGLGSVECWMDDREDKAKTIHGYWDLVYNIGRCVSLRQF